MYLSPTKAVELYDVSKPTLYKDMNEGRLSYDKDKKGRKIQVAELQRVYQLREEKKDLTLNNVKQGAKFTPSNVNSNDLKAQINTIREQIEQSKDREIHLLEQQIEQLRSQVESLNHYLEETRKEHRSYLLLLEDKRTEEGTKVSQHDEKIDMMQEQLNLIKEENKRLVKREEERNRRIELARKKREEEKQRQEEEKQSGFFSRLFG